MPGVTGSGVTGVVPGSSGAGVTGWVEEESDFGVTGSPGAAIAAIGIPIAKTDAHPAAAAPAPIFAR